MSRGGRRILADSVWAAGPVVLAPAPPLESEPLSPREREIEARARAAGRAEGTQLGRDAGLAEGRRAAEAELCSAAQALAQAMRDLAGQRQRFLADAKDAVLRLALAVARKILHGEVSSPGGGPAAARVVEAALAAARDAAPLRVRLSPQDRHLVSRVHDRPPNADPGSVPPAAGPLFFGGVELVADPSISPGGCVVETDCGSIDAQVETQWDEVQAALEEAAAQSVTVENDE